MALKKRTTPTQTVSNGTYVPSMEDGAKIKIVNNRYELAHRNQMPFWLDFDRYYKMYESYVNDNAEIWQTKIFIPMVFSVIERFLPRIMAQKPTVNFMARRPDSVDSAQRFQSLFDWQWEQVSRRKDGGMFLESMRFVKEALITGTAVAKLPWILEGRDTKMYNDKDEVVNRYVKYFDGPDFELIDPYDFFYDPEAYDIQRASWIIHRTRKTLDEMREINASKGVEIYKNLNILQDLPADNLSATENDFKMRRKVALGSGQVLNMDDTTDKYELMECWGLFPTFDPETGEPTPDQNLEPRTMVLANRKVIVRDMPFPYWHGKKPFVKYTPFPRSFEFYGVPLIKHLERIQFYMNEFLSQKFDNQVIELNQMIVVDPRANLEDWQLVWRPGGVIRANPEYVKPLALGDVTNGIDGSLQYLSQVSQLTTGLSDYYTTGVNAEETMNKTATGANNIQEQISERVQAAVQVFEEQTIKEIGYQWHGLDAQFIKLPVVVRVIGQDGKPNFPLVHPEDARFQYDVIPEAGSTQPTNEALQRQQFIQAVQLIGANPIMAQQTDWQAVEKEIWTRFGIKEGDKLMVTTPGSNPSQMPGGNQLPGDQPAAPGQMPTSGTQMTGQMAAGAAQGNPAQAAPGGAQAASQAPRGTVSTKLSDLTIREQEQWLQNALGITPDTGSRLQQFAQAHDQAKVDRGLDLIDRHVQGAQSFQQLPGMEMPMLPQQPGQPPTP